MLEKSDVLIKGGGGPILRDVSLMVGTCPSYSIKTGIQPLPTELH